MMKNGRLFSYRVGVTFPAPELITVRHKLTRSLLLRGLKPNMWEKEKTNYGDHLAVEPHRPHVGEVPPSGLCARNLRSGLGNKSTERKHQM